jgi:hypothetical protein
MAAIGFHASHEQIPPGGRRFIDVVGEHVLPAP